jgi:HAD superfamily hydrolase (TIGR01549 family)
MTEVGFADRFAVLLNDVDLVTFDVFDTALVRGVLRPEDLFLQLAHAARTTGLLSPGHCARVDIARARSDAEHKARRQAWKREGRAEVRLDEIYALFGTLLDLDANVLDRLMRLETQLERAQNVRNPFVAGLHDIALRAGKRTGFLSDMYLDQSLIRQMLEDAGYTGFEFLRVSSTAFQTKAGGALYRRVLGDCGVSPERWLHIGDNPDSDLRIPRELGIRTLHYEKVSLRLQADPVAARRHLAWRPAPRAGIESRLFRSICAGLVSNRRYCNPDPADSKSEGGFWTDWGYRHGGPLLAGFGSWLVDRLRRLEASQVYFLARDGFLTKRAVDRILATSSAGNGDISTAYLFASRRSYNFAAITQLDDDSLAFLTTGTSTLSARQFLARIDIDIDRHSAEVQRAGFSSPDELVRNARQMRSLRKLLQSLEARILDQAQAEFATLKRYFIEQGLLDRNLIAVIDLGWHGSLQRAVATLLRRMGSKARTVGLYLGTFAPARRHTALGLTMAGYLCENGLPSRMDRTVKLSVEIIEWMFSAPHGSLRRFVETPKGVEPVLAEFDFEPIRWDRAHSVQHGALEFLDDYLARWRGLSLPDVPPQAAVGALGRALKRPSLEEAIALGDMKHVEGFGHVAIERYVARPSGSLRDPLSYPRLLKGYRDSFWRAGYARRMLSAGGQQ